MSHVTSHRWLTASFSTQPTCVAPVTAHSNRLYYTKQLTWPHTYVRNVTSGNSAGPCAMTTCFSRQDFSQKSARYLIDYIKSWIDYIKSLQSWHLRICTCHDNFTENATSQKPTRSRNPNFSVQISIRTKSQFEFVPRDTEEFEFLDLVDSGGVAMSVETVIRCRHGGQEIASVRSQRTNTVSCVQWPNFSRSFLCTACHIWSDIFRSCFQELGAKARRSLFI